MRNKMPGNPAAPRLSSIAVRLSLMAAAGNEVGEETGRAEFVGLWRDFVGSRCAPPGYPIENIRGDDVV